MAQIIKILLPLLLLVSCDLAPNRYGEPVPRASEMVERDLAFLDCKVRDSNSIRPRLGVVFDRANNALLTYRISIYSEDMPSMDNHWVDQVNELLKKSVFDDGSNHRWRYGIPASNDVNVWRTLNSNVPLDLKPSETAFALHRDTLELYEWAGDSSEFPLVTTRSCALMASWESLREITINFNTAVRERIREVEKGKEDANQI